VTRFSDASVEEGIPVRARRENDPPATSLAPCCHSRVGGNPGSDRGVLDPCLRSAAFGRNQTRGEPKETKKSKKRDEEGLLVSSAFLRLLSFFSALSSLPFSVLLAQKTRGCAFAVPGGQSQGQPPKLKHLQHARRISRTQASTGQSCGKADTGPMGATCLRCHILATHL